MVYHSSHYQVLFALFSIQIFNFPPLFVKGGQISQSSRKSTLNFYWKGLMLKLKLQCFGHLIRRVNSLEKTLMLGKIEDRRRQGWRWPKYWSFSFSFSPSNEYSGLISFRIDWFGLLAFPGTLKSLLQHHRSKASVLWHSPFFMLQFSHSYMMARKTIALTMSVVKDLCQ